LCLSVVMFVCLLTYRSRFNSSLHQTLHTGGHWSQKELINFFKSFMSGSG